MKAILCALLMSSAALAQSPDAPVVDVLGASVRLKAGEAAPFDGRLLSEDEQIRRAKRLAAAEGELAKAQESMLVSKPVLVAIIVGSLVVGVGAGFGVALAVRKP
jgi:hypothetical protein